MRLEIKQSSGAFKYALIAAVLGLSLVLYVLKDKYDAEREKSQKLAGNAVALIEEIELYKLRLDDSTEVAAARVQQLTLQRDDFLRLYRKENELNKKLKVRIDELQSITMISMKSRDTVKAETVYDTSEKTYRANYSSKWIDIEFIAEQNKDPVFTYEKRDSLNLIKEIEQAQILWGLIRWKKNKSATYHLVSHDDKTQITGFKYIEVIK